MGASLDNNKACLQHQELHFCTLCEKCVGSLASPANQYKEDAGDGNNKLPYLPADRPHFFSQKNGTEIGVAAYTRVQAF